MSMSRLLALAGTLRGATGSSGAAISQGALSLQHTAAGRFLGSVLGVHAARSFNTSLSSRADKTDALVEEPKRRYRNLEQTELWHEAWMYEDRFGTEDDPVVVPSLEGERIIGVTDPDDDNLVVWGILKDGDPPRQFIEGGEFYLLQKVPYIKKVGDVMDEIEARKAAQPLPAK